LKSLLPLSKTVRLLLASLLMSLILPSTAVAVDEGVPLLFRLVPSSSWTSGTEPTDYLPEGKVFLFREGTYTPAVVLDANRPGRVPPGSWVWIAEAPGYVSVVAGTVNIPKDLRQEQPKGIYWPVVPACRIVLDPGEHWSGVQRMDVVSVTSDAVYPVVPKERQSLWVPAGRLLAYSVGPRGLQGIDDLGQCAQNEEVRVSPPAPPDGDHQELMLTFHIPEKVSEHGETPAAVRLELRGARPLTPTAEVTVKNRVSAFFLDVPASRGLDAVFRHPALRTRRLSIEAAGGSARELPEQTLEERLDLTLDIDYRPLEQHEEAEVWAYQCGLTRTLDPHSFRRCQLLDQRPALQPGLQRYRLDAVDDGLLYLEGRIDGFVVPGLGTSIQPYIDPSQDQPPQVQPGLLHEQEIHGAILLEGDPVPGEVELLAMPDSSRRLRDHRFPTDDDGTYRLRYFGRVPEPYLRPPGFEDSSNPEDLLGLYGDYQLVACTETGFCRPYSVHSVLQGSGRLDLDLGDGAPVEISVTDEESSEPIADAIVSAGRPAEALYFHHGEVDWFEPAGSEGSYVWTGADGRARLLAKERGEAVFLLVHHPDYEPFRQELPVIPGQRNTLDVALRPKKETTSGVRLVFPDGSPVSAGFLLVIDPVTGLDPKCSGATSSRGFVDLSDRCLFGRVAVAIAPGARISLFEGTALTSFDEVEIPRAPSRPLIVRVVDEDGQAIEGVPIELRYPDVTLGPNDFLLAATYSGHQMAFLTNADGEVVLRGVDPAAVTVPDVGVVLGEDESWESLASYQPGDLVVLSIRPPSESTAPE